VESSQVIQLGMVCPVCALSAGSSLLFFLCFTWPLGAFWSRGIASSSQNIEHPAWRTSIAGDHLQLLYHFDLVEDMFKGRIPFFQLQRFPNWSNHFLSQMNTVSEPSCAEKKPCKKRNEIADTITPRRLILFTFVSSSVALILICWLYVGYFIILNTY
jgi:hypothetical protein